MNYKRITAGILSVVIAFMFVGCNPTVKISNRVDSRQGLEKLELSGETEVPIISDKTLTLSINPSTTAVTVTDTKNNKKWSTNPSKEKIDKVPSDEGKKRLSSQLTVTYRNNENKEQTMNNYDMCILKGQYEFYKIENGIKVIYNIGDYTQSLVPGALTQERFENDILKKSNEDQQKWFNMGYSLIIISEIKAQKQKDEYLEKYPILSEQNLYILKSKMKKSVEEKVSNSFKEIGYSDEDLQKDNELIGLVKEGEDRVYFSIPIEYRLDKGDLVVSVPADEVEYSPSCKLGSIDLLEGFGATQSDDGYAFIPDGSGSIVRFNNGKSTQSSVPVSIYGPDDSIFVREEVQVSQRAHLPVYGIKDANRSFLAIIEDGAAYANVIANSSRDFLPYNQVYVSYFFLHNNTLPMRGTKSYAMQIFEKMPYQGSYTTRYKFLYDEKSNYVGMANRYREYLIENEMLTKKKKDSSIPLVIELIGAVDKVLVKAGIPLNDEISLTSFEQAQEIITRLKKDGIDDLKMKYTGWYNGGVRQRYPTKVDVENTLGSKSEFLELLEYAKEQNVELYPSINMQYVDEKYDGFFERFNHMSMGAKFIVREYAFKDELYVPNYMRFNEIGRSYVVSPTIFDKQMTKYLKDMDKNNIKNLSFETLGNHLNSDYNTNENFTGRQDALKIQKAILEKASAQSSILLNGCNDYAIKYADIITNIPTDSSRYYYTDESIPFMQIVLHGYVDYTGKPLNLSGDYTKDLLKTIECGAAPSFTWFYEENYNVMNSRYSRYYSSNYQIWYDKACALYKSFNEELGDTANRQIVDHEAIKPDVTMTQYDNGTKVYVNCTLSDVTVQGVTIPAESYKVIKGGV